MNAETVLTDLARQTSAYRDHVIMWAKDASRAIDYVETRPDFDHQKLAYYGYSWGAEMGGIVPAVDPRIKVAFWRWEGSTFIARCLRPTP